jgi:hypothetical protein
VETAVAPAGRKGQKASPLPKAAEVELEEAASGRNEEVLAGYGGAAAAASTKVETLVPAKTGRKAAAPAALAAYSQGGIA